MSSSLMTPLSTASSKAKRTSWVQYGCVNTPAGTFPSGPLSLVDNRWGALSLPLTEEEALVPILESSWLNSYKKNLPV